MIGPYKVSVLKSNMVAGVSLDDHVSKIHCPCNVHVALVTLRIHLSRRIEYAVHVRFHNNATHGVKIQSEAVRQRIPALYLVSWNLSSSPHKRTIRPPAIINVAPLGTGKHPTADAMSILYFHLRPSPD